MTKSTTYDDKSADQMLNNLREVLQEIDQYKHNFYINKQNRKYPHFTLITNFATEVEHWVDEPVRDSNEHKKVLYFAITASNLLKDLLSKQPYPTEEQLNIIINNLNQLQKDLPRETGICNIIGSIVLALVTVIVAIVETVLSEFPQSFGGPHENYVATKYVASKSHRLWHSPADSAIDLVNDLSQQAKAIIEDNKSFDKKTRDDSLKL